MTIEKSHEYMYNSTAIPISSCDIVNLWWISMEMFTVFIIYNKMNLQKKKHSLSAGM